MTRAPDATLAELGSLANDLGDWARKGVRRLGGRDRHARTERLVAWVTATLSGPGTSQNERQVAAWVESLDAAGQAALAEQVHIFLADFELDLDWLTAGELTAWPALATSLRALVTHYCLACQAAVESADDAERFRRRRLWQRQRKAPSAPPQPNAD